MPIPIACAGNSLANDCKYGGKFISARILSSSFVERAIFCSSAVRRVTVSAVSFNLSNSSCESLIILFSFFCLLDKATSTALFPFNAPLPNRPVCTETCPIISMSLARLTRANRSKAFPSLEGKKLKFANPPTCPKYRFMTSLAGIPNLAASSNVLTLYVFCKNFLNFRIPL